MSLAGFLRGDAAVLEDRTLVVQFSRMQQPRPTEGDACVLWRRWRFVEDRELYNLDDDPSQQNNVIDMHPQIANRLRNFYRQWWSRVAPRVNEHAAITIGSDEENPQQLSPADWEDSFLDQGRQVREGLRRNGAWNVVVDRAGEYEFEIRRWAKEVDAPFSAPLPAVKHADGEFPAGAALPVAKVRLRIADFEEQKSVTPDDKSVTFSARVAAGRTKLQAWFLDAADAELSGAYYVYVRRK
jgi:arylsulfatase